MASEIDKSDLLPWQGPSAVRITRCLTEALGQFIATIIFEQAFS
jgi:hypothetical protein